MQKEGVLPTEERKNQAFSREERKTAEGSRLDALLTGMTVKQRQFLLRVQTGQTDKDAADGVCSRNRVYEWKKQPRFVQAYELAKGSSSLALTSAEVQLSLHQRRELLRIQSDTMLSRLPEVVAEHLGIIFGETTGKGTKLDAIKLYYRAMGFEAPSEVGLGNLSKAMQALITGPLSDMVRFVTDKKQEKVGEPTTISLEPPAYRIGGEDA